MAISVSVESPQAPSAPAPRRWPLIVAVGLHLAADLAIALFVEVETDNYLVALMLGVFFAQVALIAVWTAWAPGSFAWRLGTGLLAIAGLALTFALAVWRNSSEDVAAGIYALIFLIQWLLLQGPLWIARALFDHRLGAPQKINSGSALHEFQFGVGQLLALTACVAVLFGLARWLFSPEVAGEIQDEWRVFLAVVVLLAGFSTLAPLPAIWASFARRPFAWLAVAAVYVAAATLGEDYLLEAALGDPMEIDFFAVMNGSMFVIIAATLLSVRYCGYRLATRM